MEQDKKQNPNTLVNEVKGTPNKGNITKAPETLTTSRPVGSAGSAKPVEPAAEVKKEKPVEVQEKDTVSANTYFPNTHEVDIVNLFIKVLFTNNIKQFIFAYKDGKPVITVNK